VLIDIEIVVPIIRRVRVVRRLLILEGQALRIAEVKTRSSSNTSGKSYEILFIWYPRADCDAAVESWRGKYAQLLRGLA
jgi:hypothetical protein